MTELIRPAATEEDKAIFNVLLEKISAVDSYFCCGGTLELVDRPLTLYYKSESGKSGWLDFGRILDGSVDNLLDACVPAPHGRGEETVLDESYRLARELHQNEFALSIDLLSEIGSGILSSISAMTAGRFILSKLKEDELQLQAALAEAEKKKKKNERYAPPKPYKNTSRLVPNLTVVPRLYKLNAYTKNGFFKSHRDTPKGNDHIGTLMIALPVAHQGGALRVNHDGKEIFFDWHQQCSQGVGQVSSAEGNKLKITLPWAFLFSDVEHEVLPVESGTRVTIAYDIFASQTGVAMDSGPVGADVIGTTIPLYEDFVAALRNPSFLTKGAKVAVALSHSYPMTRRSIKLTDEEFVTGLKGVDAIVYRAMRAAGFDVHLRAVMKMVDDYEYDPESQNIPEDGYGPMTVRSRYSFTYLVTSKTFSYEDSPDLYVDEGGIRDVVKQVFDAQLDPQLMWVKKPKDTFINAGAYLAYSNEYSMSFFYAAAAFILDVPPYGTGSRAFS